MVTLVCNSIKIGKIVLKIGSAILAVKKNYDAHKINMFVKDENATLLLLCKKKLSS
jgi:hypothetical protein